MRSKRNRRTTNRRKTNRRKRISNRRKTNRRRRTNRRKTNRRKTNRRKLRQKGGESILKGIDGATKRAADSLVRAVGAAKRQRTGGGASFERLSYTSERNLSYYKSLEKDDPPPPSILLKERMDKQTLVLEDGRTLAREPDELYEDYFERFIKVLYNLGDTAESQAGQKFSRIDSVYETVKGCEPIEIKYSNNYADENPLSMHTSQRQIDALRPGGMVPRSDGWTENPWAHEIYGEPSLPGWIVIGGGDFVNGYDVFKYVFISYNQLDEIFFQ